MDKPPPSVSGDSASNDNRNKSAHDSASGSPSELLRSNLSEVMDMGVLSLPPISEHFTSGGSVNWMLRLPYGTMVPQIGTSEGGIILEAAVIMARLSAEEP